MKNLAVLILSVTFISCSSNSIIDDEFRMDLGSINNKINGELLAYEFDGNIEKLNYSYYINYLEQNERISAKGVVNKIKYADSIDFLPGREYFTITLLYKKNNIIISDNSNTDLPDTIIFLDRTTYKPILREVSVKIFNR